MTKRGWWKLKVEGLDEDLDDNDLEHIAELVRDGYNQGEILHDVEEEEA